jgi:glycosidase
MEWADGGSMLRINTTVDDKVFAFIRKKNNDQIIAVFNFSAEPQKINLKTKSGKDFKDIFTGEKFNQEMDLEAWEYRVYVNN